MNAGTSRQQDAQAIFLVAYHIAEDGTPYPRYRDRLARAAEVSRALDIPILCLGGRLAHRALTNGAESKAYLTGTLGVSPAMVRTIDEFPFVGESVETIQEAHAAASVAGRLGITRLVVVADLLQLTQVRLVVGGRVEVIPVLTPSIPSTMSLDDLYYFAVRCAALAVTVFDRQGRALGWLRGWRSGRWRPARRRQSSNATAP